MKNHKKRIICNFRILKLKFINLSLENRNIVNFSLSDLGENESACKSYCLETAIETDVTYLRFIERG
jgi:hypothetical protein